LDLSESAIQLLPKEVDFANQLIAKRGFSWTRFLTELEQVIPAQIAVNSVRLDQTNSIVYLTGSALNLEAVTALTVTFQDHPRFKDPVLGQHRDAGNGVVEFDLTLRYKNRSQ
jgi:Tfp pilus assembly protein PilN